MPFRGHDVFFPDPGKFETMHCKVCDATMDVARDCDGPTGFAAAMARRSRKHDRFVCPFTDEDWHKQALNLTREAESTSSKKVEMLLLSERSEVIANKKPTKKASTCFFS